MDIIIQGPIYPETEGIIGHFDGLSFVDQIIISTWEGQHCDYHNTKVIYNQDVELPGVGNRNRQIKSTRAGLDLVASDVCAKFRSDQIFPSTTLIKMNEFYQEHQDNLKIFTLGLYRNWPFHPRDHMFWGPTDKLKMLFNCPYDTWEWHADYNYILRAEAWLGCHYAANYDPKMLEFLKDPQTYLVDNAPKINEAFKIHNEWFEKLFYPFPRISYSWPKVGISEYYYDYTATHSEYWHEEIIASQ